MRSPQPPLVDVVFDPRFCPPLTRSSSASLSSRRSRSRFSVAEADGARAASVVICEVLGRCEKVFICAFSSCCGRQPFCLLPELALWRGSHTSDRKWGRRAFEGERVTAVRHKALQPPVSAQWLVLPAWDSEVNVVYNLNGLLGACTSWRQARRLSLWPQGVIVQNWSATSPFLARMHPLVRRDPLRLRQPVGRIEPKA
jgi:hypothetical protein